MIRRSLIVAVLSVFTGIGGYLLWRPAIFKSPRNILVLSFCSLREDVIGLLDKRGKALTPHIDAFFGAGSVALINAINPLPWTTIFHHVPRRLVRRSPNDLGYEVVGFDERGYRRIPRYVFDENGARRAGKEKNFRQDFAAFKGEIARPRTKPYLAISHMTYMHYPYIDGFNEDSGWDSFLSKDEKARLKKYFAQPESYPEKLVFLLVLSGDTAMLAKQKKMSASDQLMGLVANKEMIRQWKNSVGYAEDLQILRKVYDANARYLDQQVGELLEIAQSQENTLVLLIGDHGEMSMDHDELTHSTALFESAVQFPVFIRWPGQTGGVVRRTEQVQMSSLGFLLKELMSGNNDVDKFLRENHTPVLPMRDCANSVRGLRTNNFKYIVRLADGEKMLYDLRNDPLEQRNLAAFEPERLAEAERLYWQYEPTLADLPSRHCED